MEDSPKIANNGEPPTTSSFIMVSSFGVPDRPRSPLGTGPVTLVSASTVLTNTVTLRHFGAVTQESTRIVREGTSLGLSGLPRDGALGKGVLLSPGTRDGILNVSIFVKYGRDVTLHWWHRAFL